MLTCQHVNMSTCQHVNLKQQYSTDTHATHTRHIRYTHEFKYQETKTNITCDNLNGKNERSNYISMHRKNIENKRQLLAISDMTSQ